MNSKQLNTCMPFRIFIYSVVYFLFFFPAAVQANTTITSTNEIGFTLYTDDKPIVVNPITITPNNKVTAPGSIGGSSFIGNVVNNLNKAFTFTAPNFGNQSKTIIKAEF